MATSLPWGASGNCSPTWLSLSGSQSKPPSLGTAASFSYEETVWDLLQVLRSPGKAVNFRLSHLGPGVGVGGQREENICDKSVNEPPLQNKQGGLGRWTWETRRARAAGLPLVSRETVVSFLGSREGRKRQRWCLQHELEPPVAPEEWGTVKTGSSCWSGSLTLDLTLPDNDSPGLTSPKAIHQRPRYKPSLTASAWPGKQAPWLRVLLTHLRAGAIGSEKNDSLSQVSAHPRHQVVKKPGDRILAWFFVWASSPPPPKARALDSHLFFPEKFHLPDFGELAGKARVENQWS